MPAGRFCFSEVFEVVPSRHAAFDAALEELHASLRPRPACLALDKTVRIDACTSLINVIVWHHWRSKKNYRAARKSADYVSFLSTTRRFCASRRSVVAHPVVAELAYHVRSGAPCANLSPSADAEAREYVEAEEAVTRWERRRFRGEIPEHGAAAAAVVKSVDETAPDVGSDDEASSSGSSSSVSLLTPPAVEGSDDKTLGRQPPRMGVKEELAATLLTKGWLAELADMEVKWRRRMRGAGEGDDGWERMDEKWLLDMILA